MRRLAAILVPIATMLGLASAAPSESANRAEDPPKVIQGTGDNVWSYGQLESNKAKVGDPANRQLVVRVKNGNTVHFEVTGNQHGVIFEDGKSQLKAGVFEVVPKAGELDLQDPGDQASSPVFLPAYYNRDDVKLTVKRGRGPILTIKINKLEPGLAKGILFGCNPHSRPATNNNVTMLGVIVLDEGKDAGKLERDR